MPIGDGRADYEDFSQLGKSLLKEINGAYIVNKYGNLDGLQIKQKLYEERIKWIKKHVPMGTENFDNVVTIHSL